MESSLQGLIAGVVREVNRILNEPDVQASHREEVIQALHELHGWVTHTLDEIDI